MNVEPVAAVPSTRRSSRPKRQEHHWIIPEVVNEVKVNRETGVAQVYRRWKQGHYLGKASVARCAHCRSFLLALSAALLDLRRGAAQRRTRCEY